MNRTLSAAFTILALSCATYAAGEGYAVWRANLAPNYGPQITDVACTRSPISVTCDVYVDGVDNSVHTFDVDAQVQP